MQLLSDEGRGSAKRAERLDNATRAVTGYELTDNVTSQGENESAAAFRIQVRSLPASGATTSCPGFPRVVRRRVGVRDISGMKAQLYSCEDMTQYRKGNVR